MARGTAVTTSDRAWWEGTSAAAAVRYPGAPERHSTYVPVGDGTRLAVHVFTPAGVPAGEKLPTIICMTPYFSVMEYRSKTAAKLAAKLAMAGGFETANGMTPYGFVIALVDIRGSGASFGQRSAVMMQHIVEDMRYVIDWIVAQPWSNGRVGATGISAVGMTAEWLATLKHEALRAIMPRFTVFDVFGGTHTGGLTPSTFMKDIGRMLHDMDANRLANMPENAIARTAMRMLIHGVQPVDEDTDRSMLAAAAKDHAGNQYLDVDLVAASNRDDKMLSEPTETIDIQSPFMYADRMLDSGVAIYAEAGWGDGEFIREMICLYNTVPAEGRRLVIGPWPHGGRWYASPVVDQRKIRTHFNHYGEMARFFGLHLTDTEGSLAAEPPIHYFTTGEERWKTATAWPPPAVTTQTWHLAPQGQMTAGASDTETVDRHTFDLTASTGPDSRYGRHLAGGRYPVRYPDRAKRDQGLLFYDTPALPRDVEVTGSAIVHLFAEFSTPDAAVFAYLEDVAPDGVVRHITDNMLRVGRRKISDEPAPYWTPGPWRSLRSDEWAPATPGEVVEMTFDLLPTSHLFRAGHRIRLALAGADVDTIMAVDLDGHVPQIGLHVGGPSGSFIELPVIGQ